MLGFQRNVDAPSRPSKLTLADPVPAIGGRGTVMVHLTGAEAASAFLGRRVYSLAKRRVGTSRFEESKVGSKTENLNIIRLSTVREGPTEPNIYAVPPTPAKFGQKLFRHRPE
jgi:hypothetical protein